MLNLGSRVDGLGVGLRRILRHNQDDLAFVNGLDHRGTLHDRLVLHHVTPDTSNVNIGMWDGGKDTYI